MILCVIFVVLMMFWLFFGGYVSYGGLTPNHQLFVGSTIIPWLCIAILGWIIFNGVDAVVVHRPPR